jgi:hypothetical protein
VLSFFKKLDFFKKPVGKLYVDLSFLDGRTMARDVSMGKNRAIANARDIEIDRGLERVKIVAPEGECVVV